MANIPSTSISLLKAISSGTDNVRWTEFYRKYEVPMRGFLHDRYPSVEPDDAIQDTLIALMKALPNYCYTPDEKGHFRSYLMGILSHKAADILRRNTRQLDIKSIIKVENDDGLKMGISASADSVSDYSSMRAEERHDQEDEDVRKSWQASTMEAAVEQLMADSRILPTTREVFRHVALMHEKPEDVAVQFGISRNNVDQIKKRMIVKLTEMIRAMTAEFTES